MTRTTFPRSRRRSSAASVALLACALFACACGGDDCGGFISVNASPERCAEIAEELGCGDFEVTGPTCGLIACARCEGD